MRLDRLTQRVLMSLANGSRTLGERGHSFFWTIQHNLQTPRMREENQQVMADAMGGVDLDAWYEDHPPQCATSAFLDR